MVSYYVNNNAQGNGDHEVHMTGCIYMPDSKNRVYLGDFFSCQPAVKEARRYHTQVNGCYYCSETCHTQ